MIGSRLMGELVAIGVPVDELNIRTSDLNWDHDGSVVMRALLLWCAKRVVLLWSRQ